MGRRLVATAFLTVILLAGSVSGAGAATQTLSPVADAYVRADSPDANFGTATTLVVDGSPVTNAYLRFDVVVPSGETVTKATLRLATTQSSGSGFTVHGVANSTWGERTITFANAPAIGPAAGSSGSYAANAYVAVDVTALVTRAGPVSVAVRRTSSTSNSYGSREAATNRPQLVVTTAPRDTTPPDTTITSGPTGVTTTATPSFAFTASESPATFECRLDTSAFAACSSPHTTATLAGGPHTFEVRARDAAGNLDPTPAARSFTVDTTGATPQPSFPIRAAFYYPWYPETWTVNGKPHHYTPTNGEYSSTDPVIIDRHIAAMKHGRIQAGIASWWGQGSRDDKRLPLLLAGSARAGGFPWTLYYECEGASCPSTPGAPAPAPSQISADLAYIRSHYASDPNYLKVNGRPVIFVWADGADGCATADRWKQANVSAGFYVVLKVFSGYRLCAAQPDSWHQYGPASPVSRQQGYSYSIGPGFWRADEATPRLARDPARWAQNVRDMVASGDPWQLITTFNEWGEGTAVEPAQEWASPSGYGTYLDALRTDGQ